MCRHRRTLGLHGPPTTPAARAERALDVVLSDVRYGLGAYLGVYLLTEQGWNEASIGLAFSFGGLVGHDPTSLL